MESKKMTTKKQIIQQPFTNEFGTVNVGDTVMAVTTGYSHNVSVYKAKYLGYIESQGWGGAVEQKVKLEVEEEHNVQVWADNGREFNWSKEYNSSTWPDVKNLLTYKKVMKTRKATLQLNRIAPIKQSDFQIVDTVGKLV
jgi:plastocyanin